MFWHLHDVPARVIAYRPFSRPAKGDTYQVDRALEAFRNGGFFGTGPGQGEIKRVLPDAHADFIFAVAGEEFGLILTALLVMLFGFIVWRGMQRARDSDNFICYAGRVGPAGAIRWSGFDSYGFQPASAAGQRHDIAVQYSLAANERWRLVWYDAVLGLTRQDVLKRSHS